MHSNVASYLSDQANKNPNGDAVIYNKRYLGYKLFFKNKNSYRKVSFLELEKSVNEVLESFKALGISKGVRVLVLVKPGYDLIRFFFALLKLGAVPVLIDPGIGVKKFFKYAKKSKVEAVIGDALILMIARLFFKDTNNVNFLDSRHLSSNKFKKTKCLVRRKNEKENKNNLAAILFTSGSTGVPKGVCYTHDIFISQIKSIKREYSIEPGEVDFPLLPIFALFNPALGMCTVVPEINSRKPSNFNPGTIVNSINFNNVTNSFGAPTLWEKILNYCEQNNCILPTLKRVIIAGAPVDQSFIKRFKKIIINGEIYTPYGATEALPITSISGNEILDNQVREYEFGRKGILVGSPLPGIDLKIIDPQKGEIESINHAKICSKSIVGEIIVKGPIVTQKYDNLAKENSLSKIKDEKNFWHRMGDLGWIDEKNNLWFCGRKAERVISDSCVYDTVGVESIFNQIENVRRSALINYFGKPAVVIEPKKNKYPYAKKDYKDFIKILQGKALSDEITKDINQFFFEKEFPVDVRHNAKIHRLSLSKKIENKINLSS